MRETLLWPDVAHVSKGMVTRFLNADNHHNDVGKEAVAEKLARKYKELSLRLYASGTDLRVRARHPLLGGSWALIKK